MEIVLNELTLCFIVLAINPKLLGTLPFQDVLSNKSKCNFKVEVGRLWRWCVFSPWGGSRRGELYWFRWVLWSYRQGGKGVLQEYEKSFLQENNWEWIQMDEWGMLLRFHKFCRKWKVTFWGLSTLFISFYFHNSIKGYVCNCLLMYLQGIEHKFGELHSQCFSVESHDKNFHHYNFTIEEKHGNSDVWTSKLYFAEVKQLCGVKSFLCCPLEPNDCGTIFMF